MHTRSDIGNVCTLTSATATVQASWNVSPTSSARITRGEPLTDEQYPRRTPG